MTFVLDGRFEWFLEEFGKPQKSKPVTQNTLDKFREKLPGRLLEYWQEYGFCTFKDGLFWIVNPDEYEEPLKEWLASSGIVEDDEYHVIARSGFGDLYLWGKKNGDKYIIESSEGRIFKENGNAKRISAGLEDEAIAGFFATTSPETVDKKDVDTGKYLFSQAIKKHGSLKEDEVFGFEPALFAGGELTIGHINKVNFPVHLDILLQMVGEPQVMDIHGLSKIAFGR